MTRWKHILVWTLLLLPGVATGASWARSYVRRDFLYWGNELSGSRREACRLHSSGGRLVFVSQIYGVPEDDAQGPERLAFYSGDRAATIERAREVYLQVAQSGAPSVDFAGVQYARHFAALSSGDRQWASLIVPWWMLTAAALSPAASVVWRKARAARDGRASGTGAGDPAPRPV